MFLLAFLLGIYGNAIFILGIFGLLHRTNIFIFTLLFFVSSISVNVFYRNAFFKIPKFSRVKFSRFEVILLSLLVVQIFINSIGAFGPELSFDALWYHLTLPKLYIIHQKVFYIPGGLLYYSAMPKLIEMLYIVGLSFGSELVPKLIHFCFGILTSLALYKIGSVYFPRKIAIITSLIFYSNLVVGWESITAYIDLGRTFFEIMSLWGILVWSKTENKDWLYISAIILGFAISTKLLAIGSLGIFITLIIYIGLTRKFKKINIAKNLFMYIIMTFLICFPWFIFSYFETGNPIHPILSGYYLSYGLSIFSPLTFLNDFIKIFLFSDDPISPIYLVVFPLIFILIKSFSYEMKIVMLYSLVGILVWYITPRSGGGRFMLPYLPAISLIVGQVLMLIMKEKKYYMFINCMIIIIVVSSILYRFAANSKYIPVILGMESKNEFLTKNLNYKFGDFYDTDGYLAHYINKDDKVLLIGFHNLYHVNFPFIHESWVLKGDRFNYIATQNVKLPERFKNWKLIYKNDKTDVRLYSKGVSAIY